MTDTAALFSDTDAFAPELTAAMAEAFERACLTIEAQSQVDLVRELLARRIVELARQGHTGADDLYSLALKAFGFDRVRVERSDRLI
jgi:hypothetical protein